MSTVQFDEVVELALQLPPAEQARLMERLAAAMRDVLAADKENTDETPWTDEEIAEMKHFTPLIGALSVKPY